MLCEGPASVSPLVTVSLGGAVMEAKGPNRARSLLACGDVSGVVDMLSPSLVGDVAGLPNVLVAAWFWDELSWPKIFDVG